MSLIDFDSFFVTDRINEDIFEEAKHIMAIVPEYRSSYPKEVLAKEPCTPATDIYMAAKLWRMLTAGKYPKELDVLVDSCLMVDPKNRPLNAWDCRDQFDGILLKVVGKPVFRPFSL